MATTSDKASTGGEAPDYVKLSAILLMVLALGTGIAYASLALTSSFSSDTINSKIQTIQSLDLQWLYLSLVVLGRTISMVNFVPIGYKKGMKGNIRSNPFFYETTETTKPTMVLYKEDGNYGLYNRSNRSLHHMVENIGVILASIGPVGWLFPKQTFGAVTFFCIGRILHQKGYTKQYGNHGLGFLISLLATVTIEGLALIAFLKGEAIL